MTGTLLDCSFFSLLRLFLANPDLEKHFVLSQEVIFILAIQIPNAKHKKLDGFGLDYLLYHIQLILRGHEISLVSFFHNCAPYQQVPKTRVTHISLFVDDWIPCGFAVNDIGLRVGRTSELSLHFF